MKLHNILLGMCIILININKDNLIKSMFDFDGKF